MPTHAAVTASPAGLTAENVAERFGVPREVQDRYAAASHAKAAAAQASGEPAGGGKRLG